MPTIVLSGDEEFEISRRVEALKDKLLDPAWKNFNFSQIDAPQLKDVIDAAAAIPFGPGNKVILLDKCDLFTKKRNKSEETAETKAKSKDKTKLLDDLDRALSTLAEQTYLIFACVAKFDEQLKISKVVAKHSKIETFEQKKFYAGGKNEQIMTWARQEAHRFSSVIDDEAINYLAEGCEANLRQMSQEIQKAAIYVLPEKRISLAVVLELSPHFSHVFALLDHWAYGRKYELLTSLLEILSRQSAMPLLALLNTTLTKWITIKAAAEQVIQNLPGGRGIQRREISAAELAKKLAFELKMNSWILETDLKRLHNMPLPTLLNKKQLLIELETGIKTGQIKETNALTLFFTS